MRDMVVINGDYFGDNRPTTGYDVVSVAKHGDVRVITFVADYPAGRDNPAEYAVITDESSFLRGLSYKGRMTSFWR